MDLKKLIAATAVTGSVNAAVLGLGSGWTFLAMNSWR